MTKTTYKVLKLECSSCAILMEEISEETPGVKRAEVNAHKRTLAVEHEDETALEKLECALAEQGYPIERLRE